MTSIGFHSLSGPRGANALLGESEIHVWRARLSVPEERLAQLERVLPAGERERIQSRRSEDDRKQATASRGLLREVLAAYAGRKAAELRFTYGPAGKPELTNALVPDGEPLCFNSSHSGKVLLVAVGRVPSIGIDVERIRSVARPERVARRAFSDEERRQIAALPPERRNEGFITGWTRKEACVKALGEGVWSAFGRFEVSLEPGAPAAVLTVDGHAAAGAEWSLYHLEPAAGYVGALALCGRGWRVVGGTLDSPEAET